MSEIKCHISRKERTVITYSIIYHIIISRLYISFNLTWWHKVITWINVNFSLLSKGFFSLEFIGFVPTNYYCMKSLPMSPTSPMCAKIYGDVFILFNLTYIHIYKLSSWSETNVWFCTRLVWFISYHVSFGATFVDVWEWISYSTQTLSAFNHYPNWDLN